MKCATIFGLLAQASTASAFVAVPLHSRSGFNVPADGVHATAARVNSPSLPREEPASSAFSSFMMIAGVSAAVTALGKSRRKQKVAAPSKVTRCVWDWHPAFPEMKAKNEREGNDDARGPQYKQWHVQTRRARYAMGRKQKHRNIQKKLREAGIWWASYGKFKLWYPNRDKFNMYKGPDSHPDNPYFPGASGGYRAMQGWAPARLASTINFGGSAGVFAGGSLKRAVQASRPARSALVMKAHKKAASSTKNQGGGKHRAKDWGIKRRWALQGCAVKPGCMLVKQKGLVYYPGANVGVNGSNCLYAKKAGIVQWRGTFRHKEISVIPWQFVEEKCEWHGRTLLPKEYEPWMNTKHKGSLQKMRLLKLKRKEWEQSEKGKAYLAMKSEKKQKQKEIQERIRAHKKEKRRARELETAASSGSEAA
eukprot:TRINITY_DN34827_c0_g1_i1.p1 TRINITY_DN34827_c0_g1~~TRINITY_DN34827_c0_g1_i1.p1  ORF type:complete len:422 (-),score=88.56 TRINITY_DN34827_c0_g1_i1:95-1360(-)